MMRILALDDDPTRHALFSSALGPAVTHVENAAGAIYELERQPWDAVLLDYDLDQFGAIDPGTGEDVVDWIVDSSSHLRKTIFIVHSHNYIMGPVMEQKLQAAGFRVLRYRKAERDPFFLNKLRVGSPLWILRDAIPLGTL
jgi:CheY-like chemotaxis protein